MTEPIQGPEKTPQWYSRAALESRRDGDQLYAALLEYYAEPPIDPNEHTAEVTIKSHLQRLPGKALSDFHRFGILHHACVGAAELTYQNAVRAAQKAAEKHNVAKSEPRGANKNSIKRFYGIARALEQSSPFMRPVVLRDAINQAIDTELPGNNPHDPRNQEAPISNPLERYCSRHHISPQELIPRLIREHIWHYRPVNLDHEALTNLPEKFVEKTMHARPAERYLVADWIALAHFE